MDITAKRTLLKDAIAADEADIIKGNSTMKIVLDANRFAGVTKTISKVNGRLVFILEKNCFTIQTQQESFSFAAIESENLENEKIVSVQLASEFVSIAKKLAKKGDITITLQKDTLKILDCDGWNYSLLVEDSWYHFKNTDLEAEVELLQKDLLTALISVKNSAAINNIRIYLNSVLFSFHDGALTLKATDGHRAAISETIPFYSGYLDGDYIVMADVEHGGIKSLLNTLEKKGDKIVSIVTSDKHIKFELGGVSFECVLCNDAKYPDLARISPAYQQNSLSIDVKHLLAICKSLLPHLGKHKATDIVADGGLLTLRPSKDDSNGFSIPCSGEAYFTKSINCQYLKQALESITQEKCTLSVEKAPERFLLYAGEHKQIIVPLIW